ncbi:MAG TPA: hypothetical protein VMJ32_16855 [Pirellulales bacterium]|nr:hypothetical protein [Pirellulales bacterium]
MPQRILFSASHLALWLTLAGPICGAAARAAEGGAAASASAALEILPDETLAALVVPQLSMLDAKISGLGGPLQMPIPSTVMLGRSMIGLKDGLKDDGPLVLALVGPVKGDDDYGAVLGIVAADDYQKLIGQYSPQDQGQGISLVRVPQTPGLYVAQKNGFAVFVKATDDQRKVLQSVLQRKAEMSNTIAPLKSWALQQDLAYLMTPSGVKLFLDRAQRGINAFEKKQVPTSARQMENMLAQIIPMAEKEASQIGVGLRIDDDHTVHIASRVCLAGGGELSKAAANLSPPGTMPLAGLPAGPFLAAVDGTMGPRLQDWLSTFSLNTLKATAAQQPDVKISDDDWKQLADALQKMMQGGKSMAFVMGVPPAGKSMYSQMFAVMRVENAQSRLQNYESSLTTYAALLQKLHIPTMPSYEVSKSELDGTPVVEVTTDMTNVFNSMQQQNPAAPQANAFVKSLFGSEGKLITYMTAADPTTVVMAWGEPENLKTVLEAVKSPDTSLGADVNVKTTVALLPKNAQWRAFVSPSGYLEFTAHMMQTMMPQMPFQLPPFPSTPDIGFSAQMDSQNIDLEMLVPAAVLQGIGTYTQQLQHHGP